MRILHLSSLYPPHIVGGAEKSVELLAESQTVLGHTVAAACIERQQEPLTMRNGVHVYRMPHENDFWLEDWPQHSKPRRIWQKAKQQWNFAIEKRFGEVIDDFRPEVVHTHSMVDISPLVWRAANMRGIPIVHTLRDYALVCANAAMFRRGANCEKLHSKCMALTGISWLLHKHVQSVAGVGAQILDRHIDMGLFGHIPAERRRVVWNAAVVKGAAADYERPVPPEGSDLVFGYLGRINVEKGVATLLRACRRLPPTGWRLDIAGEAVAGLAKFEELAKGLPVRFLGFIDPKDFFENIDVMIAPSIWPEPLPRTILEAYSMGIPTLGSRSGGIPDLIGFDNDQWLFNGDDDAMLTAKMGAIMQRPRDSLPKRADFQHVLAETRPETVATKYLDLYRDTLQAKR